MTDKKEQKEGQKEMPIAKFRRGNVEAAVWQKTYKDKDGEERGFYSMSTSMSYKDKDGNWQNGSSYSVNEAMRLQLCIADAVDFMTRPKDKEE